MLETGYTRAGAQRVQWVVEVVSGDGFGCFCVGVDYSNIVWEDYLYPSFLFWFWCLLIGEGESEKSWEKWDEISIRVDGINRKPFVLQGSSFAGK